MLLTIIESLLEKRIGLSKNAIGSETIKKAIERRMVTCDIGELSSYFQYLQESEEEWEELIECLVIPETWFFRNKASFAFLGHFIQMNWQNIKDNRLLKILSLPCSTGEEPYSIAMTLIDAGIPEYSFHIDAVDISKRALDKARSGIYTQSSFRGNELSFKDRFFKETPDGYRIHSSIKNMIHFIHANILEEDIFAKETVYDIIFCRNLLIYMNTANIQRVVNLLNRVLPENGMLFVGHVERQLIHRPYFRWFRQPGVFACQKIIPVKPQVVEPPKEKIATPASVKPVNKKKPVQQKKEPKPVIEKEKTPLSRVSIPKETPFEEKEINSRLERARTLADRGSMDEAMKLCEEHLKYHAFDIQAHYLMGIIFHALDNEKKAEEHFLKAVYLDPNHHEALIHLSFIAEHRGESNKALHYKQRAERILQRESKI